MRPSDVYQSRLNKNFLQHDVNQLVVLQHLDQFSHQLTQKPSFFSRFLNYSCQKKSVGFYLWGGVGIGKTFLMDCFFDSLTSVKKQRIHFHHFMQEIHAKLQEYSGHVNPLALVIKELHAKVDVLCLDEFFVSDIVDAMLLTGLLEALFKEGICFLTTSNIPPQELYKNGLRRDNFLPAIALLEKNLEIIHLDSTIDYRLKHLKTAGVYYIPSDVENNDVESHMEKAFQLYANLHFSTNPLLIMGRNISVIKSCADVAWFDFNIICGPMRSKQDYLFLVEQFRVIFISHIPIFNGRSLDEVTCFIQLIDILYDAKIKLIVSAEAPPGLLYTEGKLLFDFQRIVSRLIEMQSFEYFSC